MRQGSTLVEAYLEDSSLFLVSFTSSQWASCTLERENGHIVVFDTNAKGHRARVVAAGLALRQTLYACGLYIVRQLHRKKQ
jgi:hypothetical protein